MTIGERLRKVRLEAGISQRTLCDGIVTRNMLSQIENGSARPSMDTLQQLSARLGKPVSFFLGEETAATETSPLAQTAEALERVRILLAAGKAGEAAGLLASAIPHLETAPDWIRRQGLLLQAQLSEAQAETLVQSLPSLDFELLLRAQAALKQGDFLRCRRLLGAVQAESAQWRLLMGESLLAQGQYAEAARHFEAAQTQYPHRTCQALEICYRELEDYQKAYFYACRVRTLTGR